MQPNQTIVQRLQDKGVRFPAPHAVEIGEEIDPDNMSGKGVVIHSGCKLYGRSTVILDNAHMGHEGPVTVVDCQIGPDVKLGGGYFKDAVFLAGSSASFGAHVREGTILEENASIAHTVGLKQTILFPYVTLGSLINFCDCLMAGGTDRKNHSEVGSSYIHFNYTPNQDKATASLIGDVPRGVMLNQPPIFLGGQGGLVGPCILEYGTVIAAGTIHRKDERRPNRLIFGGGVKSGNVPFNHGRIHGVKRIVKNNLTYIANLIALKCWYDTVRSQFVSPDFSQRLMDGAIQQIQKGIDERIHRLNDFILKVQNQKNIFVNGTSKTANQKTAFGQWWPQLEEHLKSSFNRAGDNSALNSFMDALRKAIDQEGKSYLRVIKKLDPHAAALGTNWLQSILDEIITGSFDIIPSFE